MCVIPQVFSSAVEHGIADPAIAGSIPAAPLNFLLPELVIHRVLRYIEGPTFQSCSFLKK